MSEMTKKSRKQSIAQKVYHINQAYMTDNATEATGELEYKVSCPRCAGRAFDISRIPQRLVRIRLKCPHCKKIVEIPVLGVLKINPMGAREFQQLNTPGSGRVNISSTEQGDRSPAGTNA